MTPYTLLLVGCGKMGRALLDCWQQSGSVAHIHVIAPHHAQADSARLTWHRGPQSVPAASPSVIVLAVKPQLLDTVLPLYAQRFGNSPLYISIAAGKTLHYYAQHLGGKAHVVRAMPNTPALVGQGMTALCASPSLPPSLREVAGGLMQAAGEILWLENEKLMDAVSAISGCGPAYVFLFMESLTQAGVAAGLDKATAEMLAVQTVSGSAALARQGGKDFAQLRTEVASPGGMTQAALDVLMQDGRLQKLMEQAVRAAVARARELAA